MPKIHKVFNLEVTPEQFLNNCSSEELQELELLLGKPQYQNRIDREEKAWTDVNGNVLANLEPAENNR